MVSRVSKVHQERKVSEECQELVSQGHQAFLEDSLRRTAGLLLTS